MILYSLGQAKINKDCEGREQAPINFVKAI
jgi:hypothetical protein